MLSWRGPNHPRHGGAEVYTERVLSGLVEEGHEVTWYSGWYRGDRPHQWNGIRLEYGLPSLAVYPSGHLWARHRRDSYDLFIDQINSLGFCLPSSGLPTMCLIHQLALDVWDAELHWPLNRIGRRLEQAVLSRYRETSFVTVSQSTLDALREAGWRGEGHIVHNGVDRFTQTEKSPVPVITFLGRFKAKAKRLDHAVAIHQLVRKELPECELWVIGRGKVPKRLVGTPGVKVFDNVADAERDRLLGASWCCLATSVREGWGLMVSESAAAGTPTVGYAVSGLCDSIVDGVTGFLVRESPYAAAAPLLDLFRSPDGLAEMTAAAQKEVQDFTWRSTASKFRDIVQGMRGSGNDDIHKALIAQDLRVDLRP